MLDEEVEYAGFWVRAGASLIDSVLILIVIVPLIIAIYGTGYWQNPDMGNSIIDSLINYILPAIAVLVFWVYKSATPGKMMTDLVIVDANTGEQPTISQYIIRYIGYYIAAIPLGLGIMWVGWDKRKQGWHDKLAKTVVVKKGSLDMDESIE